MTTTDYTDRYVSAVVRGVPERQRADLEKELRASLADDIEARIEAGADHATAEYAAIQALGDPIVLSAHYAGRPLHLVGPALYADWKRLLTALELIVVPIVVAALAVIGAFAGDPLGKIVGGAAWTGLSVAVHLAFWVTVTFALIERLPAAGRRRLGFWNPDMLPETSARLTSRTEFTVETILSVLVVTALLLSPYVSPFAAADGAVIGFFHPFVNASGLVFVLVAAALLQIAAGALRLRGRWTMPHAIGMTIVDLAAACVVIALAATDRLLNAAFFEAAGWGTEPIGVVNVIVMCVGALAIATSTWENIRSVRRG